MANTLGISEAQAANDISTEDQVGNLPLEVQEKLGNTYANIWLDPSHGRLDIGTAPVTTPNLNKIRPLLVSHGLASVTDFVPVRSTYQQLVAAQNGWNMRVGSLMQRQQAATMVDGAHDAVVIQISDTVPAPELQALIQAASTDSVTVKVATVPPAQLAVHATTSQWLCTFKAKSSDYCTPPLIGGTEIYSEPSGGYLNICTAGFVAQSIYPQQYPDHYMLTAGHCFLGGNAFMYGEWGSADNKETPHGIGFRTGSYVDERGDAAFIDLDRETLYWVDGPQAPWYPQVYTPGKPWGSGGDEQYNLWEVGTNYVNQTPCHSGMASGVQCGVTEYTNVTTYIQYGGESRLVGNLVRNSACSSSGDSGGPWIFENYAMGLDVAAAGSCGNGGIYSLYDDMHATDHDLGMRVVGLWKTIE